MEVKDVKPSVSLIETKPTGGMVLTVKPNLTDVSDKVIRFYPVSISSGQSMGLLLALTYPTSFTVSSPITT
jgi:hypothetical protein